MASAAALLKILAQLFLLMSAGFIFRKIKILEAKGRKLITAIVMNFFLPCSILKSFIGALDSVSLESMAAIVGISLGISLLGILIGLIFRIKKADGALDRGTNTVIRYGLICSNVTFMGIPLISALFGNSGLILWSIYMIPFRIVMWTYGTGMFTRPKANEILKKFLLSPSILSTALGILLMFMRVTLPDFLTSTLSSGGAAVTPLTMLVIGSLLAESKPSEVFNKHSVAASGVRLIVMPIIVLAVTSALKFDPLVVGVSTVLAGMPYATTTAMFAEQYDCNAGLAAQCVFVTTLLSAITVTILMILFNLIYPGIILT